jgi:hypothetical protein
MALAKPSPIVTAVSGPVGGSEFFRFGNQTRIAQRRCKCTSTTERALNARAQHIAAIAQWHALDAYSQSRYRAMASRMTFPDRFGTPRKISPFQLFLKWYPWCAITQVAAPTPYYDAPVTDFISPGPGSISLIINTTPYAEITTTSGLFLFFLSWWHYDVFGPHNKPGLKPKQWTFVANTRMWAYTQDVTTDFTTAGIPFIEGAIYSIRLRVYVWRNWPSAYISGEGQCTAP